jgi:valyl-tRNA synthetase
LTVATTRPETLFGDVAIAVNPKVGAYLCNLH